MTFQLFEVPSHEDSTGDTPTRTKRYKATGSTNISFVESYALGATSPFISTNQGTLYRQDINIQQVAYNQFDVSVPYGRKKKDVGEWTWDFDTTGGTIHITNSKETVGKYPTDSPDFKGAIAVEGDQVKGTDIVIPALKINVAYKHPLGVVNLAYAKFLAGITGTVNNDTFLTFAPGEVLYLGSRGSDGTTADASVSYQFAMSVNATGLSIGDIAGIAKEGWHAMWIRYEDATDDVGGTKHPVRRPKSAHVERVYETIAMADALGFGG